MINDMKNEKIILESCKLNGSGECMKYYNTEFTYDDLKHLKKGDVKTTSPPMDGGYMKETMTVMAPFNQSVLLEIDVERKDKDVNTDVNVREVKFD
ncbi:hypothetical protein [Methanobrevibacter sp. DSM 116169]|uniref:hypothetical protein n=1 Tax=Methanobrevibacter sp. DSM 116169 TaxID=3242727 RepID=UPI0038FCF98D